MALILRAVCGAGVAAGCRWQGGHAEAAPERRVLEEDGLHPASNTHGEEGDLDGGWQPPGEGETYRWHTVHEEFLHPG